jgi:adenylosuccinate lyase
MTPKNTIALEAHLQAAANVGKLPPKTCLAIAAILYEGTPPEHLRNLEEIEKTVRQKVLKHVKHARRQLPSHRLYVSPEIGVFLSEQSQVQASINQASYDDSF